MNRAFSLVELSIVLVILGLLTGGILAGQSLIRASELRSVSTEYSRYITATHSFRDKYFALPGDITNATNFWGTMSTGTCPNATAGTGTQTCNGDGDGTIDSPNAASQSGEAFTFWQHLANAGLIEGSYTGIAGAGGSINAVFGQNSPQSKLGGGGGWGIRYTASPYAGSSSNFSGIYSNYFELGVATTSSPQNPIMSAEEGWNVDTKLDDGKPGTGRVKSWRWTSNCTTAANKDDYSAAWALSISGIYCNLLFVDIF